MILPSAALSLAVCISANLFSSASLANLTSLSASVSGALSSAYCSCAELDILYITAAGNAGVVVVANAFAGENKFLPVCIVNPCPCINSGLVNALL